MLFFYKSCNKRLLKHIKDLDEFGLLPQNWKWHKKEIEKLNFVSKELIEDLNNLHNAHQNLGHTIPLIMPLIQELHKDLEKLLKENSKKDIVIINNLIKNLKDSLEKQGYFRYGTFRGPITYLTPKEIAYYNSLVEKKDWKKALRYIKNKWNKRVDRNFIQNIKTIHWNSLKKIEFTLTKLNTKKEMATIGYQKPPYLCNWIGGIGILIKGYVTLAGNIDLQTNQWSSFSKNQRYTEYAEHLIINKQTFKPQFENKVHRNEFIINNWQAIALIFDEKKFNSNDFKGIENKISYLKEFAKRFNLPLIDINGNII